jgi:hypothetical protein
MIIVQTLFCVKKKRETMPPTSPYIQPLKMITQHHIDNVKNINSTKSSKNVSKQKVLQAFSLLDKEYSKKMNRMSCFQDYSVK